MKENKNGSYKHVLTYYFNSQLDDFMKLNVDNHYYICELVNLVRMFGSDFDMFKINFVIVKITFISNI